MSEDRPKKRTTHPNHVVRHHEPHSEHPEVLEPALAGSTRVALVNLDEASQQIFRDAFGRFEIDTVAKFSDKGTFLHRENFQGCVLGLRTTSAPILEAARTSVLNRHTMIYGISGSPIAVIRFQKYGLNAILDSPLDPNAVMEVVKATQSLLKHQVRRFVRLPLMTMVQLNVGRETIAANSRQISPAGMCLVAKQKLHKGQTGRVTFTLPNMLQISTEITIRWVEEETGMIGVSFEASGEGGKVVKNWMEEYLAIA